MKTTTLFLGIAWAAFLPWPAVAADQPPALRAASPNVLLVIVDDLGWRDLGCYGSTLAETPEIDRLAAQGLRFSDAYVAYPRCVPSRYGMLTARHPARVQGNRDAPKIVPGRDVTIGSVFAAAGYDTYYNGKWHLGENQHAPGANGFGTTIAAGAAGATRSHFAPYTLSRNRAGHDGEGGEEKAAVPDLDDAPRDEYLTDRQTSEAIKFLRAPRTRPFFMVQAFYAVHTPLQGKEEYHRLYRQKLSGQSAPEKTWEKESAGENLLVQNNPVYAAMVRSVDENVGRLLTELETLRLAENTIVVLVSDNGGLSARGNNRELATSNRPLRAGKGHLYEGGIRVPFLIRWPGSVPAGRVEHFPVSTLDLMPTLAELAGLTAGLPAAIDGRSIATLFRGGKPDEAPLFWHNPAPRPKNTGDVYSSAVRLGRLKLIEFPDHGRVELYDLAQDLGESHDLAAQRPQERDALLARLQDWRREVGASAPKNRPAN